MANWGEQLELVVETSRSNLGVTLTIVSTFWAVHILNVILKQRLSIFGIWPRHPFGLIGIFCSPWLHGDFSHLAFNSIPLYALINLMLLYGWPMFISISIFIILTSGLATWLVGRRAIHIGASGLILGYWGFLLLMVIYEPSIMAVFIAIVCLYYFGGLFSNLVSAEAETSFEGHVLGFASGLLGAYLVHNGQWTPILMKTAHWLSLKTA